LNPAHPGFSNAVQRQAKGLQSWFFGASFRHRCFAEFELCSGAVLSGPACEGIAAYPVKEEEGVVLVALERVG
jgi:hypothetical protein